MPYYAENEKTTEYESAVQRPGKFEGESRYIPYFWEQYLDGGADEDDGTTLTFRVTDEDKELFPELKGRKAVKLMEREDGFVVEVSTPARATYQSGSKPKKHHKKSDSSLGGILL